MKYVWSVIKKHRFLASALFTIAVVTSVLGVQIGFIPNSNAPLTVGQGKVVFRIGTEADASSTVDYVCDGTDDNIQIQGALDALPANGGEIQILAGNYDFTNLTTVTRALANVTIRGVGRGTYITCDGVTPIFTAGGNNWVISDLRTDAGSISMGATTGWIWENVTINATYYTYRTDSTGNITTGSVKIDTDSTSYITFPLNGANKPSVRLVNSAADVKALYLSSGGQVTLENTAVGLDLNLGSARIINLYSHRPAADGANISVFHFYSHDSTNTDRENFWMSGGADEVDFVVNTGIPTTVGDQLNSSNILKFLGRYWNGGADASIYASMQLIPTATTPAGDLVLTVGNGGLQVRGNGDTDDYFTLTTVGNIPTLYGTGAYARIGDAATTSQSLASEDDLMVTGKLEVDGNAYADSWLYVSQTANTGINLGTSGATLLGYTADADAFCMYLGVPPASGTQTPVALVAPYNLYNSEFGYLNGLTNPTLLVSPGNMYTSSSSATGALGDADQLVKAGKFGSSVAGDWIRITAGTNATAGWYYIKNVVSADAVDLDRNFVSGGDASGVVFQAVHQFASLSTKGVMTGINYGAPSDSTTDMDRDGWLILDTSQASGRLYWRANNAWHYVDATGGVSLPASERTDENGHTFQIGDTVTLKVDRINADGSFHALPVWAN